MTINRWTALAAVIVRKRKWVLAGWCIAALLLIPYAPDVGSRLLVSAGDVDGSESDWVDQNLDQRFRKPFASQAVLVVEGIPLVSSDAGREVMEDLVPALLVSTGVSGVLSYLQIPDSAFVNPQGTFVFVALDQATSTDVVMDGLRSTTSQLQSRIKENFPQARLSWTGAAAIDQDVRLTSNNDATRAEYRVLPLTLLLLVLVFRSVIAALVPVGVAAFGIALSLGATALIATHFPLVVILQNVVTMLGLGLGVDYSLLMVSRFRQALDAGNDAEYAAVIAAQTAGHTIWLSGIAVIIGFIALIFIPTTELRSIAMGGVLIVTASVLLATTLLPAVLAWLGERIDTGRFLRGRFIDGPNLWRRWGRFVVQWPGWVLFVGGSLVAILAWQTHRANTNIPSTNWLPGHLESMIGVDALRRMGHSGVVQTLHLIVEFPEGVDASSEAAWNAIELLSATFSAHEEIASVLSLPGVLSAPLHARPLLHIVADIGQRFISEDRQLMVMALIPRETSTPGRLSEYVRELREMDLAVVADLPGTEVRVGGLPAANADYQDAVGSRAVGVILFVISATFVAIAVGFRSVVIALKAVTLNLLSVAGALGAAVLVFQDGWGAGLFGIESIDGLFPAVPIFVFCIVFGLSIDYEVFLIARISEQVRAGLPDRDALVEGMALSGGVITSAALVMIVVFLGFAMGDFLIVKILGFTLAVAVLLDATIIRMVLGPALFRLAGRWNWWPGIRS